jgi:ZIP family zinc transporter
MLFWILAAGGGTSLGALLLLIWKHPSDRLFDLALAGGAGIMLAATVLGLLPLSLSSGNFWIVALGFSLGVGLIALADFKIPHWHARFVEHKKGHDLFVKAEDAQIEDRPSISPHLSRAVLLVSAIALHNLPEGMAIGIAFAEGEDLGIALALAILIHNIPEGLAVALPMRAMKMSLPRVIAWTTLTGVVEIIGALGAF